MIARKSHRKGRENASRSSRANSLPGKSQDINNNEEFQPQILRKPEVSKSKSVLNESGDKKDQPPPAEVLEMKSSSPIIVKNHMDTSLIASYLDLENTNFYVVGVVGLKDSGKSTILNLLVGLEFQRFDGKLSIPNSLFNESSTSGNSIDLFITKDRLFLLDSAPILHNTNLREFITTEADDFKQIQALLRLCHELVVVFENHQVMNLMRMLIGAKIMMNPYECEELVITFVENRVQPGSKTVSMCDTAKSILTKSRISESINVVRLPEIGHTELHHEGLKETVGQLRDDINTRQVKKSYEESLESEKAWLEKLSTKSLEGGEHMKRYEGLREKFYQINDDC